VTLFTLGFRLFFIQLQINQPNYPLKGGKRKDGVEEVEEAGLVIKHIFWRSAGGNALEGGQGYEFMTAYDTIVSMGAESMHVPRMSSAWGSRWWWKGMGAPLIRQYGKVKLAPG
jgi:hypothetical protein